MIADSLPNLPKLKKINSRFDSRDYVKANGFLRSLKRNREALTEHEYSNLRELALGGCISEAEKKLEAIVRRYYDTRDR